MQADEGLQRIVYPRAVYWLLFCSVSAPMTNHFLEALKVQFTLMISHLFLRQLDSFQMVDALEKLGAYQGRNQLKSNHARTQMCGFHLRNKQESQNQVT